MTEIISNPPTNEGLKSKLKDFLTNRAQKLKEEAEVEVTPLDLSLCGLGAVANVLTVANLSLSPDLQPGVASLDIIATGSILLYSQASHESNGKIPLPNGGYLKFSTDVMPTIAKLYEGIAKKM